MTIRSFASLIVFSAVAFVLVSEASAQGVINACVNNKTGAVRIITSGSCKQGETQISWPGSGATSPLKLVDSNGIIVGPVIDASAVIMTFSGVKFYVGAIPSQLIFAPFSNNVTRYYESADCSGTPYLEVDTQALFRQAFIEDDGNTLRYADPHFEQERQIESVLDPSFVCHAQSFSRRVAPIATQTVSGFGFTPPFHVE